MNIRLLTVLLIFVSISCIVNESYACVGIPIAVIDDPDPKYSAQDVNVYFEGENSYDTDPPPEGGDYIVDYYWVWPSGSYDWGQSLDNGHLGWAKFSSTGERKVGLFVQDDEENWSTKQECTVRIVEVGLSSERGYVAVNNDDDNANETPDYHSSEQTVTGENDLVEIYPSVNPTNDWQDCKVRLSVYGNQYCIKIWSDQNKVNQVIPDGSIYYKDYDPSSLPDKLYVEGISTTPAGQTVDIALLYQVDSLAIDQVDIDLIVLEVDQDMLGVDDTSLKTEEITPGGFIALNEDDDNDNGTPDKDESGSVTNEDDLVMLTLYKVWPTDLTGNVTLKAIAGGAKIKIWGSQTKGGTPITLPETYATPSDLPEYLWVEGYETSTSLRDITLALEYTIGGTTFDDRIKVTVLEIDLDIDGISDADEESIGEVVVLKFDNNNAPRKEVILRKVEPSEWSGDVILSRDAGTGKVELFHSQTGGTEIAFNGTDNRFANSELPKTLWAEGDIASSLMRDVLLDLGLETPPPGYKDKVTFTVLWVNLSTDHSGSLETDNAGRDEYSALVVPPPCYTLGYHLFCTYHSDFSYQHFYNGRGSEFIGDVEPPDFIPSEFSSDPDELHLARERVSGNNFWGPNGYENSLPTSPGDDTSGPPCRDDDPQSGGSMGVIYDHDAPGFMVFLLYPNYIIRKRTNYREWAEWDGIRCSTKKNWFTRQSYKKTGSWDFGTSTSGTANTLTDSSKSWTSGIWSPGAVKILDGTGKDQVRRVTSNTGNTITVTNNWSTIPDDTSVYELINTSTWTQVNDVSGDNVSGDGTTNITWNLQ